MSLISEVVDDLAPSGIREFFDLVMGMDDVISLGVGEPDFDTPDHIRRAMIDAIEAGHTSYTSNQGMPELRETIADFLNEKHGLDYNPDTEILITVGVSEAMDLAMRALINPGDEVIVPTPCYVSYGPTARMAGGQVVNLETREDNNFRVTPEQLEEHLSDNTKIMTLNFPANPTGVSYSRDDLEGLAEVLKDRDVTVFSDEIYGQLTYEGEHTAFPTLPGMKDKTLYLNGFSKAYAMTGLRIGYAAGPEPIISAMTKIHQYTMLCVPTASQFAGVEALLNGAPAVESMREEYEKRRDLVIQRLNDMGLTCARPSGAFYAFPSVASTGMDPETFCRELLEEQKVAAVPGSAFGPGGEDNIRLSYATGMDQLREALDRMQTFVDSRTAAERDTGDSVVS